MRHFDPAGRERLLVPELRAEIDGHAEEFLEEPGRRRRRTRSTASSASTSRPTCPTTCS
jgi:hypothetical protein